MKLGPQIAACILAVTATIGAHGQDRSDSELHADRLLGKEAIQCSVYADNAALDAVPRSEHARLLSFGIAQLSDYWDALEPDNAAEALPGSELGFLAPHGIAAAKWFYIGREYSRYLGWALNEITFDLSGSSDGIALRRAAARLYQERNCRFLGR